MNTYSIRSFILLVLAGFLGIIAMVLSTVYGSHAATIIQLLGIGMLLTAGYGIYVLQKKPKSILQHH